MTERSPALIPLWPANTYRDGLPRSETAADDQKRRSSQSLCGPFGHRRMKKEKPLGVYLQQVIRPNISGFASEHGMSYPAQVSNGIVNP